MHRIRLIALLFSFLSHPPAFARRASDVFVEFAQRQLGDSFYSVMGGNWPRRIHRYTIEWTDSEAEEFLDILVRRTSHANTIERIKSPSHLQLMRLEGFKTILGDWDNLIGADATNERLNHSLGGFNRKSVEVIRDNRDILKRYVGQGGVVAIATGSLQGFTRTWPRTLEATLLFLEEYFGLAGGAGRETVADILIADFEDVASTKRFKLRDDLHELDRFLGKGDTRAGRRKARPVVAKHYSIVASLKPGKLKTLTETLDRYLERDEGIRVITDHLPGALKIDLPRLRRVMEDVRELFGERPHMTAEVFMALADPNSSGETLARLASIRRALGPAAMRRRFFEGLSPESIDLAEETLLVGRGRGTKPCTQLALEFIEPN